MSREDIWNDHNFIKSKDESEKPELTFQDHKDNFSPPNCKYKEGIENIHVTFLHKRNGVLPVKNRQDQFLAVTKLIYRNSRQIINALEVYKITDELRGFTITYFHEGN